MNSTSICSAFVASLLFVGSALADDAALEAVTAQNYREVLVCIENYEFADVNQQAPIYDTWCPTFARFIDEHTPAEMSAGYRGDCSVKNVSQFAYALLERKRLAAGGMPFTFKTVAHADMTINRLQPVLDAACPPGA